MKTIVGLLGLISFNSVLLTTGVFSQVCFFNIANLSADESWNKFVVIQIGSDSAADHAKHAKQIGYSSIGLINGTNIISQYRNNPDLIGLKFFLIDPQHYRTPVLPGHSRNIDTTLTSRLSSTQAYSQSDMDFYNQNMVLKSTGPSTNNLATGWWTSDGTVFGVRRDFQQQAVIKSQLKTRLTLV
jgi:hypothetical protein